MIIRTLPTKIHLQIHPDRCFTVKHGDTIVGFLELSRVEEYYAEYLADDALCGWIQETLPNDYSGLHYSLDGWMHILTYVADKWRLKK